MAQERLKVVQRDAQGCPEIIPGGLRLGRRRQTAHPFTRLRPVGERRTESWPGPSRATRRAGAPRVLRRRRATGTASDPLQGRPPAPSPLPLGGGQVETTGVRQRRPKSAQNRSLDPFLPGSKRTSFSSWARPRRRGGPPRAKKATLVSARPLQSIRMGDDVREME